MKFAVPVAVSACVALFLLWLRNRKRKSPKAIQDSDQPKSGVSRALHELQCACTLFEAEMQNATESRDKIRRVLLRLYDAIEIYRDLKPQQEDDGRVVVSKVTNQQVTMREIRGFSRESDLDDDDDSFVSASTQAEEPAVDSYDFEVVHDDRDEDEVETVESNQLLYDYSLELARRGEVPVRKVRLSETGCTSAEDFTARLYCVRKASQHLLSDTNIRDWLVNTGKIMMIQMLKQAGTATEDFEQAFDRLMQFIQTSFEKDQGKAMLEELSGRGVVCLSLYDAVLDLVLFDAFDDMKMLPNSVISVLESNWVPKSAKAKTLSTAIWSVLRTRSAIASSDGLLMKFYDVMQHVSPVLACGLLKCSNSDKFSTICNDFKDLILQYTEEMFQFDAQRCRSIDELSTQMLQTWRSCAQINLVLLNHWRRE